MEKKALKHIEAFKQFYTPHYWNKTQTTPNYNVCNGSEKSWVKSIFSCETMSQCHFIQIPNENKTKRILEMFRLHALDR